MDAATASFASLPPVPRPTTSDPPERGGQPTPSCALLRARECCSFGVHGNVGPFYTAGVELSIVARRFLDCGDVLVEHLDSRWCLGCIGLLVFWGGHFFCRTLKQGGCMWSGPKNGEACLVQHDID